jgi:citronellol/citronellal dehydrogenase
MADAAKCILLQPANQYTGNFVIDEVILRYQGVTDFSRYRVDPKCKDSDLMPDFFLPENPFANATVPPLVVKLDAKL